MSRSVLFVAAGVLIVMSVSAMGALFIISQTAQALVLQFGKPIPSHHRLRRADQAAVHSERNCL